jgi:tetratricopeptide (TPR) repeat protein
MMQLRKLWTPLSILFYIGTFAYLILYKSLPITTIILPYIVFFVLTKLIFIGNTVGSLGLFIHISTRNDKKARPYYAFAYRFRSTKINIIATYALMVLKDGDIALAKDIYTNLLSFKNIRPSLTKIIYANLAICHWKLGELQKAIDQYQALFDDEDFKSFFTADDYTTLGYLHLENNNFDAAEFYTKLALKLDEEHVSAMDNLGQMYYRRNNFQQAISYFQKAITLKEYTVDSNYYLGRIFEENKDFESAKKHYENALQGNITALNTITKEEIKARLSNLSY